MTSSDSRVLLPSTRIRVPPLSRLKRSGRRVLLVAPDVGCWGVVEEALGSWLEARADTETTVRSLEEEFGVASEILAPTLAALSEAGLLELDGVPAVRRQQPAAAGRLIFLVLRVTEHCNLRCTYCYEGAGDPGHLGRMSETDAAAALDFFARNCAPLATILFIGGEALLEPAFLERNMAVAHQLAEREGKRFRFAVQTNGTVASPRVLELLAENRIALGVSYDGLPEIHDAQRPFSNGSGSAALVWRNIQRFVEAGVRVSLMVTVSRRNVGLLPEICTVLQREGVERVKFSLLTNQGRALSGSALQAPSPADYVVALSKVVDAVDRGEIDRLRVEQVINLLNQVLLYERIYLCDRRVCGAASEFIAALPDGYFYPCDTFPIDPLFRIGRIGELDTGTLRHSSFARTLRGRSGLPGRCPACGLRSMCGGGCPSNAINDGNGLQGIEEVICATSTALLPEVMWKLATRTSLLAYHRRHAHLPDGAHYRGCYENRGN